MTWKNDSDKSKNGNGTWNKPVQGPWGQNRPKKSSGGGEPPDLDHIFKGMQNFGGGNSSFLLGIVVFIALGFWGATGIFQIDAAEQGVILRFGKYDRTVNEGLHWHLPIPFERVHRVNVQQARELEIGPTKPPNYDLVNNKSHIEQFERQAGYEQGLMLTGDENFVVIQFTIRWDIADPVDYLFNVDSPQDVLYAVAESAMREVVGSRSFKSVTEEERDIVTSQVKELIQKTMNNYHAGVNIISIQLKDAAYPPRVAAAFLDVAAAGQDAETKKNDANKYENEKVPAATAEANAIIQQAEAYKAKITAEAKGEAERFTKVYQSYRTAPGVTRRRIYLETMEEVLARSNKVILDDSKSENVVPYLPLNELRKGNQ